MSVLNVPFLIDNFRAELYCQSWEDAVRRSNLDKTALSGILSSSYGAQLISPFLLALRYSAVTRESKTRIGEECIERVAASAYIRNERIVPDVADRRMDVSSRVN
ncbi:hypothetical protein L1887_01094 [Cichorium endivia]|nr:hypothetical protein L1887_01094 [Cichorium endivia]